MKLSFIFSRQQITVKKWIPIKTVKRRNRTFKSCPKQLLRVFKKLIKMVSPYTIIIIIISYDLILVSSMQRMVNQIGSHQDSPELRKQLHSLQHYTQQLVKDTNGYIKDLANISPSLSQSEQRQRKMQRERLHDEFTTTLNLFQQVIAKSNLSKQPTANFLVGSKKYRPEREGPN